MKRHRIVTVIISALVLVGWGAASAQAENERHSRSHRVVTPAKALPVLKVDTATAIVLVDTRTVIVRVDTASVLTHFDTSSVTSHESHEANEVGDMDDDGFGDDGDDDSHQVKVIAPLGAKALPVPASTVLSSPKNQRTDKESSHKHKG